MDRYNVYIIGFYNHVEAFECELEIDDLKNYMPCFSFGRLDEAIRFTNEILKHENEVLIEKVHTEKEGE